MLQYVIDKKYNTDFGDAVVLATANALNLSIMIINIMVIYYVKMIEADKPRNQAPW